MAYLDTVEQALAAAVAGVLYPNGTGSPSAVGAPVRIFRGWPSGDDLDKDLAAGVCQVSIYERPGMTRPESSRLDGWELAGGVAPTMTATLEASEEAVTFAGAGLAGQIAGVAEWGRAWTVPATGTPAQVAAALAAAISVDRAASATGATLTLPGAVHLVGRVAAPVRERRVARQQAQGWQVTCWCPTVELREAVGRVVDMWVARTGLLALPDGEQARVIYGGTRASDEARKSRLQRRDIWMTLNYPTTDLRESVPTVFGETELAVANGATALPDAPVLLEIIT